jgi:hypothetical protein
MIHAMIAGKSAPSARIAARSMTTPPEACGRANRVTNALISASFTAQAVVLLRRVGVPKRPGWRRRASCPMSPGTLASSVRTSPRRSATTNVLPSRTLKLRSDTREGPRGAPVRHRPVGSLVGGGDDINVAVLATQPRQSRAAIRGNRPTTAAIARSSSKAAKFICCAKVNGVYYKLIQIVFQSETAASSCHFRTTSTRRVW